MRKSFSGSELPEAAKVFRITSASQRSLRLCANKFEENLKRGDAEIDYGWSLCF
jgi:hypothetical protein